MRFHFIVAIAVLTIVFLAGAHSASAQETNSSNPAATGNVKEVPPSTLNLNGKETWVSGTNVAWVNFARDLGPDGVAFSQFDRMFRELRENGGNSVRFWMHTTGAHTPSWNGHMVTGPGPTTLSNLKRILDMAESYDVVVLLSLWSFDMQRKTNGTTITDRARAILTQQANRDSYIQNSLIPMVEHVKGHPAILAWEIFNEAEGMSEEFGWDMNHHVPMKSIQEFVNQTAGAIKRTDPNAMVTTGIVHPTAMSDIYTANNPVQMNYYRDDRLKAAGGDTLGTLDFYTFHFYGYGDSPFVKPASYFELDKEVFLGEFYIKGTTDGVPPHEHFQKLMDNGYAGALSWQWVDWAQNRENNQGTWLNTLPNTRHIYSNYREYIDLELSGKPASFTFSTSDTLIERGTSIDVNWRTRGIKSVTLNGDSVALMDGMTMTLDSTTTFELTMVTDKDSAITSTLTVRALSQLEWDRMEAGRLTRSANGRWATGDMVSSYALIGAEIGLNRFPTGGFLLESSLDGYNWSEFHKQTSDLPNAGPDAQRTFVLNFEDSVDTRFIRIAATDSFMVTSLKAFGLLSEIQPPTLDILEPGDGDEFDTGIEIEVKTRALSGSKGFGRTGVNFYLNGEKVSNDRISPYTYAWTPTEPGEYTLQIGVTTADFSDFRSRPVTISVLEGMPKERYEAEDATYNGTIVSASDAEASGGEYLYMTNDGEISWKNVMVYEDGEYTLSFGYYLPFDHKTQYLRINGTVVDTLTFPVPTEKWLSLDVKAQLKTGYNEVDLVHSWGWMRFDYLEVRGSGVDFTSVESDQEEGLPVRYNLEQNHPNPFNPSTVIRYSLARPEHVRIEVYSVTGELMATLENDMRSAGEHTVQFDASHLSSGLYLYRIVTPGFTQTRKMLLVK